MVAKECITFPFLDNKLFFNLSLFSFVINLKMLSRLSFDMRYKVAIVFAVTVSCLTPDRLLRQNSPKWLPGLYNKPIDAALFFMSKG